MRYYRGAAHGHDRLLVQAGSGSYDLTSAKPELRSFMDLVRTAAITDRTVDEVADRLLDRAESIADASEWTDTALPVSPQEVWAAGVTYRISEEAREAESAMPDLYRKVYRSERPELFFKATPSRLVGPGEAVGIRADSEWDVPEPELALVLYRGEIVGFTVGNDMSSRSIEGENALYLPQAKIYDGCCAIGPCVVSTSRIDDPQDLDIEMRILRDGEEAFVGRASTAEMVKSCESLATYLTRSNPIPDCTVLLTGTGIVPEETFSLRATDYIQIDIEGIGALENDVRVV